MLEADLEATSLCHCTSLGRQSGTPANPEYRRVRGTVTAM